MDINESYTQLYQAVLREHEQVFRLIDMEQVKNLVGSVTEAKKIFVMGAGREGISLRSFAMRLSHLGKETHWIWDDTTPAMGVGDLFLVSDGRGDIGMFHYILDQAAKAGTKIFMITGLPEGRLIKKYADACLFVHAKVYMGEGDANLKALQKDVVDTVQPMGNLYEQHLYLLLDIMTILIKDELGLTYQDMEKRHRNIE